MIGRVKNVYAQAGRVSDVLGFYGAVLDARPQFVDGERWAQFRHEGMTLAVAGESEAVDGASGWVVTFEVDDVDAAVARAVEAGGSHVLRRDMGDHGMSAIVRDPAGNLVTLWAAT